MSDILIASSGIGANNVPYLLIHPATAEDRSTPEKLKFLAEVWQLQDVAKLDEAEPSALTYDLLRQKLETAGKEKVLDIPMPSKEWESWAREYGAIGIFLAVDNVGTFDKFQQMLVQPKKHTIFYGLANLVG